MTYLFETSNYEYLKSVIRDEFRINASEYDIKSVLNHPIVLWHSQGNKVNLKIRAKNNLETELNIMDAIGLTFTGIGWPRPGCDLELQKVFNRLINKVVQRNDDNQIKQTEQIQHK